jgi:hypothetical protein
MGASSTLPRNSLTEMANVLTDEKRQQVEARPTRLDAVADRALTGSVGAVPL